MNSKGLIITGALGIGALFFISRFTSPPNTNEDSPFIPNVPISLTIEDRRVNDKISPSDVGTSKNIPIVSKKVSTTRDKSMRKDADIKDVIRYNTAPTATDKIKAAVKVLPKNQSIELSNNLKALGW